MTWGLTFLIAVGLAMDAFSVALGVGASLPRLTPRHMFRLSWHFGLFQFMMPVLGWAAGSKLEGQISSWSHWLAFLLLTLIGARMIVDGLRTSDSPAAKTDPTRGISLVTLSLATSFDALAVGLSLAAIGVAILYPSILIGVVAGTLTLAGMWAGRCLGRRLGQRVSIIGGLVLTAVGVKILLERF